MTDIIDNHTDNEFEPPGIPMTAQSEATLPESHIREFLSDLEGEDLTHEQKLELIRTYVTISWYFTKMAHGLLPFQMFNSQAKPCGKPQISHNKSANDSDDMVYLEHHKNSADDDKKKGGAHDD